jgi:hypothetical protein
MGVCEKAKQKWKERRKNGTKEGSIKNVHTTLRFQLEILKYRRVQEVAV